jgi:hypothetical protein
MTSVIQDNLVFLLNFIIQTFWKIDAGEVAARSPLLDITETIKHLWIISNYHMYSPHSG